MTADPFGAAVHPMGGFTIMERPDLLRYDDMRVDFDNRVALVGEVAQLLWMFDVDTWKKTMRKEAEQRMSDYARRVGVAYPLESG